MPAFTCSCQPPSALSVLSERARDIGASSLLVAPDIDDYDWAPFPAPEEAISLHGQVHRINASLALQLARTFIEREQREDAEEEEEEDLQARSLHVIL